MFERPASPITVWIRAIITPFLASLFDACLKFTGLELDLIPHSEMFLIIENAIRGGISVVSRRYIKANNPLVPDYDPNTPTFFISYFVVNNLYGAAMLERLATSSSHF